MRGLGWGVGHAGLKLRAEKNPGQAGVGRGRPSMRRKEKELAGLENSVQEGFSLNKIFSITDLIPGLNQIQIRFKV
jgi:hypothetical protein